MGRHAMRRVRLVGVSLAAIALLIPWVADAASKQGQQGQGQKAGAGWVVTATNNPSGNKLWVYKRAANGKLTQSGSVSTGGKGIASQPPFGFPIVDSSGSINTTPDGKLIFVVNAGSNSVTSFRVTSSGVHRVSVASTHGKLPISVASSGNLLYVVNEISKNIYGWTFTPSGVLHPIAGSNQKLTAVTPKGKKDKVGVAAAINFTSNGKVVAVTQRGLPRTYGEINTFVIRPGGAAGPAQAFATKGVANPFGFSATGKYLLVSNAGLVKTPSGAMPNPADFTQFTGTVATYKVSSSGKVSFVSNASSGGRAACWLIITKDGKTAVTTNTLSSGTPPTGGPTSGAGAVATLSVSPNGHLHVLKQANTSPGFPGDEAFSHDDKYLYVIDPSIIVPGGSHIEVYKLGKGGSLTRIQTLPSTSPSTYPPNLSGVGAW
ncbi:MAG TPA: beta-propeller fold lactonase family protein [Solirubrobacteraceae bacterium]|nr:beta-propeller fold lactonase family protein [Solirubrobacteraceae bacterium]